MTYQLRGFDLQTTACPDFELAFRLSAQVRDGKITLERARKILQEDSDARYKKEAKSKDVSSRIIFQGNIL